MARWFAASVLCVVLLHARVTRAQLTRVDMIEHIFGASNVNAMAGHGGLTVGVSREGDVTVLAWPGPSCCDQLLYLSSNALDARAQPHFGALEGMGIVLGISIDGGATHWLHDGTWQIDQRYLDDDSLLPVTHFRSNGLDLDVTIVDAVHPELDVLSRRVSVVRGPAASTAPIALIAYANLSPTSSELPELPIADWALDHRNDFAAVWNEREQAIVQFHPRDRGTLRTLSDLLSEATLDYGSFGAALVSAANDDATAAALADGLDREFGDGVYAALSTVPRPEEHQVGFDATPFCAQVDGLLSNLDALVSMGVALPIPMSATDLLRCTDSIDVLRATNGWLHDPEAARTDADDGRLSGSHYAAGQVDTALRVTMLDEQAELRVAFGASARAALAALAAPDIETRDRDAWHAYASGLALPDHPSDGAVPGASAEAIRRTAGRALLHAAAGTARDSGAIVASIARQAPYGLDWPRDGAFFDYAFDVAGDPGRVTRRLEWAVTTMRTQPVSVGTPLVDAPPPVNPITGRREYPASAWEMNYYADGVVGGNLRFEIDNTALMVWSMAAHPGYLEEPERSRVANELYAAIEAGADLIAGWSDEATGLVAPASEDDNQAFTASLHGASAVYAGLRSAARLARYLGHDDDARRWDERADELRDAISSNYYDEATGLFRTLESPDGVVNLGSVNNGDTAWLVWPAELLPFDDPRVGAQLRADLEAALAVLRGEGEGGQYLAKIFLAAAVAVTHGGDESLRPLIEEGIARLAVLCASADTQAYGEVYVNVGTPDAPRFDPRTSNPHLWEGTLTYLAAMALEHPERFDVERETLAERRPYGGGCAIGARSGSGGAPPFVLSLIACGALVRRRRLRRRLPRVRTASRRQR